MKNKLIIILVLAALNLFTGCTHFKVSQSETSKDGITRETKTSAWTFFDSKSELAKLRASTSDKTQTTSVGALNAESNGSNAVSLIEGVTRAAVDAAVKATVKP